jgi:hypothetical protein
VSATREGAERIDESCELRVSCPLRCRGVEMLLLQVPLHNVPIIPTFGSARRATVGHHRSSSVLIARSRDKGTQGSRRQDAADPGPLAVGPGLSRLRRASPARGVYRTRRLETAERVKEPVLHKDTLMQLLYY